MNKYNKTHEDNIYISIKNTNRNITLLYVLVISQGKNVVSEMDSLGCEASLQTREDDVFTGTKP
jgi:hypothetical protein